MPRPYQIILKNNFPTEEVFVNDNTVVANQQTEVMSSDTSYLIALACPKGKDGVIQTIHGQGEFLDKIGLGPSSLYGQPMLTAYALACTGRATLHLLPLKPADAKYASVHVCAAYKVSEANEMTVRFYAKNSDTELTNIDALETAYTPSLDPDTDGFTEVKLFSIACLGRGKYGDAYQFRIDKMAQADRENNFKNYTFEIYENEGGSTLKEAFQVCFTENAVIGTTSYYADSVLNALKNGSDYVKFVSYPDGFQTLADAYATCIETWNEANPDTPYTVFTIDDIDLLLGCDKYNKQKPLALYTIDTTAEGTINLQGSADGSPSFSLSGGSDGSLSASTTKSDRDKTLNDLYLKAYTGEIDPLIYSKNKFPTNILPDCNFNSDIKAALHALGEKRGDCVTLFDAGTNIHAHTNVITAVADLCGSMTGTYESVDAYCGKVRDPYNQKIVTVTSVYALCILYANQFYNIGGKYVSVADNDWGNLEDVFIQDTIYPIFDEDIHEEIMNDLIDEHINFARVNALNEVHRSTQDTRQPQKSVLSELSNAFLVKDVKRAMERLAAKNRYEFCEPEEIQRFNDDAARVCDRFSGQVKSISAAYSQNDYESLYNIIHLYVELACRNITKSTIIEIDVNRG